MLVIFKAAHVKEQKGFHGYFEVITQESEFVMCLEMHLFYSFYLKAVRGCHVPYCE